MNKHTFFAFFAVIFTFGCQACGIGCGPEPNIREEPGAKDCPAFCNHMKDLSIIDTLCLDYLPEPPPDSGIIVPDGGDIRVDFCIQWCVNTQKNSVQINPLCMSRVSSCDQVDCASRIAPADCIDLDNKCKY